MTGIEQSTIAKRTAIIREANDNFRKDLRGGALHLTLGIMEKTDGEVGELIQRIADFDSFTGDNDPHGEHDFGCMALKGEPIFWKIDYYDLDMRCGSPDPSDPDVTRRALTVMMAWEY